MKIVNPKEYEEKKQQIIFIAKQIMVEKGIEKISMREIARHLNQTQGIIYHYFANKDEILNAIIEEGYQEIMKAVKSVDETNIEKRFYFCLKNYIEAMLNHKQIFMLLMNSSISSIKNKVSVLNGNSQQAIIQMENAIREGVRSRYFVCEQVELRAKVIWSATYGLIAQLIVNEVEEKQKDYLVEEHIKMIIQSLKG